MTLEEARNVYEQAHRGPVSAGRSSHHRPTLTARDRPPPPPPVRSSYTTAGVTKGLLSQKQLRSDQTTLNQEFTVF